MMENYQEWLDNLVEVGGSGKYKCPLCDADAGLYGRRRMLGCGNSHCPAWSLFDERQAEIDAEQERDRLAFEAWCSAHQESTGHTPRVYARKKSGVYVSYCLTCGEDVPQ